MNKSIGVWLKSPPTVAFGGIGDYAATHSVTDVWIFYWISGNIVMQS